MSGSEVQGQMPSTTSNATPRILFVIYDSRSGSSLFVRILSTRVKGLYAPPEIGFEWLLRQSSESLNTRSSSALAGQILDRCYVHNLQLDADNMRDAIDSLEVRTPANLMRAILRKAAARQANPRWYVVKNGQSVFYGREIKEAFGEDAKFIHVVRDPRGVISSKISAVRPYYPFETMGWSGVLLSALYWKRFIRNMAKLKKIGLPVLEISYADLLEDQQQVIENAAAFLDCPMTDTAAPPEKSDFEIPEPEREIHKLVDESNIVGSRQDAWRTELTGRQIAIIESVLYEDMVERGFTVMPKPFATRIWYILSASPQAVWRIIKHYFQHAIHATRH